MSSQVFAGDTSGSITIQAPAVAGTGVLTLPANTTGIIGIRTGVLQVVSNTLTTATSSSSTTDITVGLIATITPTSATSKILVMYNLQGSTTNSLQATIYRGATAICTSTAGATKNSTSSYIPGGFNASPPAIATQSQQFLDSPATTSPITYDIRCNTDAGTFYINKRGADTFIGATSTITLMEIAV
jgi:hypothetical protein